MQCEARRAEYESALQGAYSAQIYKHSPLSHDFRPGLKGQQSNHGDSLGQKCLGKIAEARRTFQSCQHLC